jgi:hypothetical protein
MDGLDGDEAAAKLPVLKMLHRVNLSVPPRSGGTDRLLEDELCFETIYGWPLVLRTL